MAKVGDLGLAVMKSKSDEQEGSDGETLPVKVKSESESCFFPLFYFLCVREWR